MFGNISAGECNSVCPKGNRARSSRVKKSQGLIRASSLRGLIQLGRNTSRGYSRSRKNKAKPVNMAPVPSMWSPLTYLPLSINPIVTATTTAVSRKNIAISNLERSLCLRLWESISTPATNSIIPVMQNRVTYQFIIISQFPCKYRVYFIS